MEESPAQSTKQIEASFLELVKESTNHNIPKELQQETNALLAMAQMTSMEYSHNNPSYKLEQKIQHWHTTQTPAASTRGQPTQKKPCTTATKANQIHRSVHDGEAASRGSPSCLAWETCPTQSYRKKSMNTLSMSICLPKIMQRT
jgi:hypothetical protein